VSNGSLPSGAPSELQKLQFDYAWKWFSFHADQRIKMFNYMLVVFGIFAAGVVNALDKELPNVATAILCFIAAALALIFSLLDRRNRDLVWLGEDVLRNLERTSIFGEGIKIKDGKDKEIDFGILRRQDLPSGTGNGFICDAWRGKHRVWLPLIGLLIAVLFLAAGLLILRTHIKS
jgi:hypothetical protein